VKSRLSGYGNEDGNSLQNSHLQPVKLVKMTSSMGILKLIQYLFQILDHLLPTTPRPYGWASSATNVHPITATHLSQPQRVGQQFLTEGVNANSHLGQ
jgi:hypothetical protein